jgi:hypothetical protein
MLLAIYLLHWLIVNCIKYFISCLLPPASHLSVACRVPVPNHLVTCFFSLFAVCYTLTCGMASMLNLDVEDNLFPLSSLGSVSDEVVDVDAVNNDDDDEEEQFQVEVTCSASAARSSSSSSSGATLSSKCKRAPFWVWVHFHKYLDKEATHVHCLLCEEKVCYTGTQSTGMLECHIKSKHPNSF